MQHLFTVTIHPESGYLMDGKPGSTLVGNAEHIRSLGLHPRGGPLITWVDGSQTHAIEDRTDLVTTIKRR